MKFSLWNFRDWYEKHDIDLSYMITENNVSISMLSTDVDASEGRLGCALVLSGDQLTDCTGLRSALQFGRIVSCSRLLHHQRSLTSGMR